MGIEKLSKNNNVLWETQQIHGCVSLLTLQSKINFVSGFKYQPEWGTKTEAQISLDF